MQLATLYDSPTKPTRSSDPAAMPSFTASKVRVVQRNPPLFESLAHMREAWRESKGLNLAYSAARPSKFRRLRTHLGGTADAHYFNEFEFWQLREYARDMDRNDVIVQSMVDRALDNILGDGFMYDPNTGDDNLDEELWERFDNWSMDPNQVDLAGKFDFWGMERMALRTTGVEGDCCLVPQRNLSLQFFEGDRLASPPKFDDVVHGVRVDPNTERPLSYYFTRAIPNQRKLNIRRVPSALKSSEVMEIQARTLDGTPNVFHIFDPARYTQNRGVTWFKSVFDTLGMFEDINFARLIQQQMVSCVAMFIEKERDYQFGSRDDQTREDGTTETIEEMSPGLVIRGRPGEKIQGFNPNIPNPDYLPYVRQILRLIGAAWGMPLEIILFDTTETNFHGYRGAIDQARQGFRRRQRWLETYLHRRVIQVLHKAWLPELGLRSAKLRRQMVNHVWRKPAWPYIDPKVDAEADRIRLRNALISPRRLYSERFGVEWDDVYVEIVDDWGNAIEAAVERAEKINKKIKDSSDQSAVTWREVLNLDAPEGMTRQEKIQEVPEGGTLGAGGASGGKPKPTK